MNPSPEQLEWYAKRDEALRLYRESGDESLAIEIGLFPAHEGETTRVGDGQVEESIEGEGDGMTLEKTIMGINRRRNSRSRAPRRTRLMWNCSAMSTTTRSI